MDFSFWYLLFRRCWRSL